MIVYIAGPMTGLPERILNGPYYSDDRATLYGDAHFQAVMATQRHERVVLLAAWREGRL